MDTGPFLLWQAAAASYPTAFLRSRVSDPPVGVTVEVGEVMTNLSVIFNIISISSSLPPSSKLPMGIASLLWVITGPPGIDCVSPGLGYWYVAAC